MKLKYISFEATDMLNKKLLANEAVECPCCLQLVQPTAEPKDERLQIR